MWQSDQGRHSIGEHPARAGHDGLVIAPASGEVDPNIKAGQVQVEIYPAGADTPIAVQVLAG